MALRSGRVRLTKKPLDIGMLNAYRSVLPLFPKTNESVKIRAVFDDGDKEIKLTYSGRHKRLFGLTGWYRRHDAKIGDYVQVEATESGALRFQLHRGEPGPRVEAMAIRRKDRGDRSRVGPTINFRGLIYAPINEQGVVFLFGKVIEDLNMYVEEVKTGYPDAICRRFDGKGYVQERVEFEFKSSDFKQHGHPVEQCDIIVCWEHDWKACPIEVIELKGLIRQLQSRTGTMNATR